MRCPKCHYLSFEPEPRCKNCGYDLAVPEADLAIKPAERGAGAARGSGAAGAGARRLAREPMRLGLIHPAPRRGVGAAASRVAVAIGDGRWPSLRPTRRLPADLAPFLTETTSESVAAARNGACA